METVIGLLIVLVPLIFQLIGKSLEKAGKTSSADKMKKVAELFGGEETEEPAPVASVPPVPPVQPVPPVPPVQPVRKTQRPPAPAPVTAKRRTAPMAPVLDEKQPSSHEKIDPKKLVVYSEIMKPKYLE